MLKYILKRIISTIPVLFIVVTFIFFLMRALPGDSARMILGKEADEAAVERLRESLGLNDPVMVQYGRYLKNIIKGDWGDSYYNHVPVFENLATRFEPTMLIMILGVLISVIFGIPIGIIGAVKRNSILDYLLYHLLIHFLYSFHFLPLRIFFSFS